MCKSPHVDLPKLSLSHGQSSRVCSTVSSFLTSFFYNKFLVILVIFNEFRNLPPLLSVTFAAASPMF